MGKDTNKLICWIADYFSNELPLGGSEICNTVVINMLRNDGYDVLAVKAAEATEELINLFKGRFVISNRVTMPYHIQNLIKEKDYIIYEHDFGCIFLRDPSLYDGYIAPVSHRINLDFYKSAKKVICQSDPHLQHFYNNSELENLVSAKSNPFSEEHLNLLSDIYNNRKAYKDCKAILDHPYWQKNTKGAVAHCQQNGIQFEVIPRLPNEEFLSKLSCYSSLLFTPLVFETFSRVCAEAACLGLTVMTNNNVSFTQSEYSKLKGNELIDYFKENNSKILKLFTEQ